MRHRHIRSRHRYLKPKKFLFRRLGFWLFLLFLLVTGGVFYLFFFFPWFQVQTINVFGNEKVGTEDIRNIAWKNINKNLLGVNYKSIFTTNTSHVKKDLVTSFPVIENVQIPKLWARNLYLEITERTPFAIFCADQNDKQCFMLDKNGIIYEEVKNPPKDSFITRQSIQESELILGLNAIDKNTIDTISKIKDNLKNNFQIDIKEVFVSNPLVFTTNETWKIYFNISQDIDTQITKMNLLLKDQITLQIRKTMQYIYLQYKDRAYYK